MLSEERLQEIERHVTQGRGFLNHMAYDLLLEVQRLRQAVEVLGCQRVEALAAEQVLGRELGYPWYCDDKKNFPDATEADGVCTGEHTVETIAREAAALIHRFRVDRHLERQWRPIETAPKDGRRILGYIPQRPQYPMQVVWWDVDERWWPQGKWNPCVDINQPTHWMPLPALPEVTSG